MIYLDQAATSFPKIKEVQDAVIDCMNHCTNANRSTSVTSLNASRLIYQTRKLIKEYFHVPQDGCVVLNSGNTESINTCIKGILKKGDHVITTYAEHNSVLRPLYQLEKANIITLSITSPTVENIKKYLQKDSLRRWSRPPPAARLSGRYRSRPAADTVPVQFSAPTECSRSAPLSSSSNLIVISCPARAAFNRAATKKPKKAPASKMINE